MTTGSARCYWVESPGRGALREERLPPPAAGEVVVQAGFGGISPGTERLVGLGRAPRASEPDMACRGMKGTFSLPVAYGYSLVGTIDGGPRAGERVFAMHPHQDRAVLAEEHLVALPENVPSPRATLFPNLETALNAVWDAELHGTERTVVIGGGAVGCLIAFVLQRLHAVPTTIVESDPERCARASRLPWIGSAVGPDHLQPGSFDVAFHASGNGAGLQLAIDALGFEGRVVELSWYGDRPVALRLGDSFHHQRKSILASQVAHMAKSHRAAGRTARTNAVLELLADDRLDGLLGAAVPFAAVAPFFAMLYEGRNRDLCPLIRYGTAP